MASYTVTDPSSGKTATLVGDSPPNEQELNEVFSKLGSAGAPPAEIDHQSNYDVAGHSTTLAAGVAPEQATTVSPALDAFSNGLLTNKNPVGFAGHLGRGFLAGIGGGILGVPGAAAGEAIRQAVANTNAAMAGGDVNSPAAVVGNVALAGAVQRASDVAAPYIESGISGGLRAAGNAVQGLSEYSGVNLAGVKRASYDTAKRIGGATVAKFVGAEPEIGDQLAEQARGIVANAVKTGEDAYPGLIAAAKANPAYAGKTFNLDSALSDKATQIADKYGFIGSNRVPAAAGASKFWEMADKAASLKDATLDEVYQLQKQLNSEASVAYGSGNKTLGAAVGDLMQEVKGYLGTQIKEIGQANSYYSAAKTLEEKTGRLTNANDLLGYIRSAYRNEQMTAAKEAIETAAGIVPGLGEVIDNINAYNAAKDFAPLVRGIPQTGFGAAALYGAGQAVKSAVGLVTGDPLAQAGAMALGAGGAAAASPRLALLALRAGQASSPAASAAANSVAEGGRTAAPLFSQALSHMAPASIAAFYRSPGQ